MRGSPRRFSDKMAKVLWEDRYFNVFFAYRGAGDLALSPGRQLEDNLTRALAATLKRVSASIARSFAVNLPASTQAKGSSATFSYSPAVPRPKPSEGSCWAFFPVGK